MNRIRTYLRTFTGFERDARLFLLTALLAGAAFSLYWIDFNLYLSALGMSRSTIGLIAALGSVASALVAFPASWLSDRIGRRWLLFAGLALMTLAFGGFALTTATLAIALLVAAYNAGLQVFMVMTNPYLMEHSRPEHRNELFSVVFAIENVTNVVAAVGGGIVAEAVARAGGFDPHGPEPFRILLLLMMVVMALALCSIFLLRDDRPRRERATRNGEIRATASGQGGSIRSGEARAVRVAQPSPRPSDRDRMTFVRLLVPGFLISIGAGQVIPFLNLFVQGKFGLDLASLNAVFAVTSLGTVLAILLQPALARRLGKMASVVAVQAASLPFIIVLGFSPVLWTVILAMAVRNSLMNAGNPIFNAYAMEKVLPSQRASFSAASSVLWSLGWAIGMPYYSLAQATLGFGGGYTLNFVTIITLYSTATFLYWYWFGREEARLRRAPAAGRAATERAMDERAMDKRAVAERAGAVLPLEPGTAAPAPPLEAVGAVPVGEERPD